MTKEVEIEARKAFNKTPQGDVCDVGERFHVGETRADELERLGLACRTRVEERREAAIKSGRTAADDYASTLSRAEPKNKMKPALQNKGVRTIKTVGEA